MSYRIHDSEDGPEPVWGTIVYSPDRRTVTFQFDEREGGQRYLPSKTELGDLFSFFSDPICRSYSIRRLNPAQFSYTGGTLVEAASNDRHLLFYVRGDTQTLHGLSARWTDGRKNRYAFGLWHFAPDPNR